MESEWRVYTKKADFNALSARFGISPVIARIMVNRGVDTEEKIDAYLHAGLEKTHSPELMKDVDKAALIMKEKIEKGLKVRIISDYDVDGVMSNYVLYDGLKRAGADVSYEIPDRVLDGYGVNERMIKDAHEAGVDTIITCDNGIAAFPAVELAKSYGMTVIVTDHHEVPYDLDENGERHYRIVPADAVVDIKQPDCPYPFKEICGAVVAYKFIRVLYRHMQLAWEDENRYIEFLAIATVCDVMSLTDENRVYVREGIKLIGHTKNKGLKALMKCNSLEGKPLGAYHLGFVLGPCINATGRLKSAQEGLSLLLETDEAAALKKAEEVVELNASRKKLTLDGTALAIEQVESGLNRDNVLVLYLPELHESLAGIVAGRVREAFYKPVFVITGGEAGLLKGSGRSIEGYHMYDALTEVSNLLDKFGGHELAAGFSLKQENLEEFRRRLNENEHLTEKELTPVKYIDVPMPTSYADIAICEQLETLEPFGKGNEKPLFGELRLNIRRISLFGNEGQYARIIYENEQGLDAEGVDFDSETLKNRLLSWFGDETLERILSGLPNDSRVDILYYPGINEYRGTKKVQIHTVDIRRSGS